MSLGPGYTLATPKFFLSFAEIPTSNYETWRYGDQFDKDAHEVRVRQVPRHQDEMFAGYRFDSLPKMRPARDSLFL